MSQGRPGRAPRLLAVLRTALGVTLCVPLMGSLATGCADGGRGGGATSVAAAVASGGSGGLTAAAAPAPVTPPAPGTLTPALRAEIARAFAPQLRFNGYHDDGNRARQNRHEDFFPMSVAGFLRELASGRARVLVQPSSGHAPGESEARPFSDTPRLEPQRLNGYPRFMVGDPPGAAPLYVHVYEDPALRALGPDGAGELTVYVEYWVFYAYDRSEARILGISFSGARDLLGHRADWEHTSFRARVRLDPGYVFAGGALEEGVFAGHGHRWLADGPELERVDDAGQPDPAGTHPVVYVSQGKHASFPQAGHWTDGNFPAWLADFTDFFRGNGVVIDGWRVPLPDLTDPAALAAEFSPPEWQALVAASPVAPVLVPDWTAWWGHFGPDLTILRLAGSTVWIGLSPTGPRQKSTWGSFHGRGSTPRWSDAKRHPRLVVYEDQGIAIPPVTPPPLPVRR